MPIYTTWLTNISTSVAATPFVNSQSTVSTWQINFDDLFRYDNYRYKKCRLRFKMINNILSNNVSFPNSLCCLNCNLASSFNASNTLTPTALNISALANSPVVPTRSTVIVNTDTADTKGVNINMPTGLQYFTISIGDDTDYSAIFVGLNYLFPYEIMLFFELYDEIF